MEIRSIDFEERSNKENSAEKRRKETFRDGKSWLEGRELKLQGMERKAQLSKQETKILKKDQIATSMPLVPKSNEMEIEKYFLVFFFVAKGMD